MVRECLATSEANAWGPDNPALLIRGYEINGPSSGG